MIQSGPVALSGPSWTRGVAFRSMRVSERISEPFVYHLEVLSESASLSPSAVLGEPLTVALEVGQGIRHFNAFPTRLVRLGMLGGHHHYGLELRPWLWFLSRATNCRVFQQLSVPDIVREVLRGHGFSDLDPRLSGSYPPREYVVQYRESDLEFVCRLLEQEGIYFFFEHGAATHTLVLADSICAHEPTFPSALPFLPPDAHRDAHLDYVDTWESVNEVESGALALTDYDFTKPRASLLCAKSRADAHPHSAYERFDFPGGYLENSEGERYATTRLDELASASAHAFGTSNARGLRTGGLVSVSGHSLGSVNREHLVVALEAQIRAQDLASGGDDAEVYRCRFTSIESSQQFRPPRVTRKPIVHGAQTATVVGKAGEEIWTDEFGRVKLRFHWDRYSSGDEGSSCWVRVAQAWAGMGFGAVHVPRVGQEVVVEFLEGDPDRPLVTGRVYNFDNMPPYELPAKGAHSGIKSRSTPGGYPDNCNEIRFEDQKGAELFFMQAERDHTTIVKNDQTTTVTKNRSASVTGNDSVSVGADRSVSVTGNLSVSVQGGQSTHSVTGKHTLTATDSVDVQAPARITLAVGASTITLTPDTIVLSAGGGAQLVLNANVAAVSKGSSGMFLDANAQLTSSGLSQLFLDANACLSSSAKSGLFLDASADLSATDGDVTILGKLVSLDGGGAKGKLDLDGSGVTLAGSKIACTSAGLNEITGSVVKIN